MIQKFHLMDLKITRHYTFKKPPHFGPTMIKKILLLSLVFVSVNCRTTAPTSSSAVKIVGGREVSADDAAFRSTVAIIRLLPFPSLFCTGTLIGSNTVVTAAHCQVAVGDRIAFGPQSVGTSSSVPTGVLPSIKVIKVTNHSCASANKYEWDLSVLTFVGPIPEGFGPPVKIVVDPILPKGTHVLAAGFGQGYADAGLDGKLRQVPLEVETDDSVSPYLIGTLGIGGARGFSTCHGDSGGPLYLETEAGLKLIGVTSFGISREGPECDEIAFFQKVANRSAWIEQAASGNSQAVTSSPVLCTSQYDPSKIPPAPPVGPPINDERRGPKGCRLASSQDIEAIALNIELNYPPDFATNMHQPVGGKVTFSAPDRIKKIEIENMVDQSKEVLLPTATGKGRNCFLHKPNLPMGSSQFTFLPVGNSGLETGGHYTLKKMLLSSDPP